METKIKNKINYGKLVKSSRDLVTNKNFRNNQNYIISDFSKFRFSSKYYKSWISKNALNIIRYLFNSIIISAILYSIIVSEINYVFLQNIFILLFLISGVIFVLLLFYIFFKRGIYYFYKKYNFIKKNHVFTSNRYIFFKNPRRLGSSLNRRDFISFKKYLGKKH